jgi:chemotaxis protein methyltransferase CheR
MSFTPRDFELLSGLLKQRSGLVLSPDKMYLLESRLTPVARKRGLPGLTELVGELRTRPSEALVAEVTEAMTTNETFFFRDSTPFEALKTGIMPDMWLSRAKAKKLRIWCAAASTGQEPYSIAMIMKEAAQHWQGWSIEILATDLSTAALEKARQGMYSQFEVQRGLPIQLMMKYFVKVGEQWQVSPEIRSMVQFKQFNLLESMAAFGVFDVIFCRNVLIYFDPPTKTKVLEGMRRQLANDGSLFLGAAETVLGLTRQFKPSGTLRNVYVPAAEVAALAKTA